MYYVTLACKGVPEELGPQGALDITEEFRHRPWHQNVHCEWNGEEMILLSESDWDSDAKALLDEFSDAIAACIPGTFGLGLRILSIRTSP